MIERHLPYFVVVAEEQHFQRAALRLNITQSALSRRIQLLEAELGIDLFERLPRGVRLSAAGEVFYNDVRSIRQDLTAARTRLRGIVRDNHVRVKVAVNPAAASCPVTTQLFQRVRAAHPNVEVRLQMAYTEEQIPRLQNKNIDLAVMYQLVDLPGMTSRLISEDMYALAMPEDHPLANRPSLRLADLADAVFIWPARTNSPVLFDKLISACNAGGLSPNIVTEVRAAAPVMRMVSISNAVCLVTRNQTAEAPPSVVVREIEDLTMVVPICIAWRDDYESPALNAFLESLDFVRGETVGSLDVDPIDRGGSPAE